jgi:hypothetical protein
VLVGARQSFAMCGHDFSALAGLVLLGQSAHDDSPNDGQPAAMKPTRKKPPKKSTPAPAAEPPPDLSLV